MINWPPDVSDKLPQRCQPYCKALAFWCDLYSLDQFLLAAIIDRETNWGTSGDLDHPGPGGRGDCEGGIWYGHGLGQIDSRSHASMVATVLGDGSPAWGNAAFNVGYAASILAHAVSVLGGDLYAATAAYNAGESAAKKVLVALPPDATADARRAALDSITTGGEYVSWVWARHDEFAGIGVIAP
jgi:hypothetical protein